MAQPEQLKNGCWIRILALYDEFRNPLEYGMGFRERIVGRTLSISIVRQLRDIWKTPLIAVSKTLG